MSLMSPFRRMSEPRRDGEPQRPERVARQRGSAAVAAATAAHEAVLADLAWETLANDLEAWLDSGHGTPFPAVLEERPAGTPPQHLERRMANLTTRLAAALRDMRAEQAGVAQSLQATARAQRMAQPNRGATASYLDTGA